PYTAAELAAEARRCVDAGAALCHVHAREPGGAWTVDPRRYAEVILAVREAAPGNLVSITSLRPAGISVEAILELLAALARDPATKQDLISVNLGHIVSWEPALGTPFHRRTVHYPNAYEEIVQLLATCAAHDIRPELGVMDLGFVSNAVALR